MDRSITSQRARYGDSWSDRDGPTPSDRSGCKVAFPLSRGEAVILVLLLSLGLWAAIWGAVALVAVDGRW